MKYFNVSAMALVTAAAALLLTACSSKSGGPEALAAPTKQMGHKLQARYYPLSNPVIGKVANHTYPEAFDDEGDRHAWKALGGDSGGKVLSDTTTECDKTEGCVDISTVNYIMTESPCIWPYKDYYAVVGVCWNATNRGLFYTGKTVHNIKYYPVIEKMYGTYGLDYNSACWHNLHPFKCKDAREKYAWTKCLASVRKHEPWRAESALSLKSSSGYDPRIELYYRYRKTSESEDVKAAAAGESEYLEKLFELNIKERLGDISDAKKQQLMAIDRRFREERTTLSAGEEKGSETFDHEAYMDALNRQINSELNAYSKVLSDEEYLKLFGASKEESFDIRDR